MRVLIVGAGIGGLAAAIALRRSGHEVVVVERAARPAVEGFSITIPSNGTRALDQLGILKTLRRSSVVVSKVDYLSHDHLLVSSSLDEGQFLGWPWLSLARSHLIGALVNCAGEVRYGAEVSKIEEHPDAVEVSSSDGTTARFDLVVGADGTHSRIRSQITTPVEAEWAGMLYYRTVRTETNRPPVMRCHLDAGRTFCIFPGGPNRVYAYGALPAPKQTQDPVHGRRQRLLDHFAGISTEVERFITETERDDEFSCTPPMWVRAESWHTKRVVLIGDAAHASPPFMAQGACLAIEDAIVLGECVGSTALNEALAEYTRRRRPRISLVHRVVESSSSSITHPDGFADRVEQLRRAEHPALVSQVNALLEPL